jgi:hypothetical protein
VTRRAVPTGLGGALLSFTAAVVLMLALGFWWVDKRINDLSRDKDQAQCQLIDRLIGDTPPPAGPTGQRAREIRADLTAWRDTLDC